MFCFWQEPQQHSALVLPPPPQSESARANTLLRRDWRGAPLFSLLISRLRPLSTGNAILPGPRPPQVGRPKRETNWFSRCFRGPLLCFGSGLLLIWPWSPGNIGALFSYPRRSWPVSKAQSLYFPGTLLPVALFLSWVGFTIVALFLLRHHYGRSRITVAPFGCEQNLHQAESCGCGSLSHSFGESRDGLGRKFDVKNPGELDVNQGMGRHQDAKARRQDGDDTRARRHDDTQ